MRLFQYKDLDLRRVKPAFAKLRSAIEAGDFRSPDVKQLHVGGYYRAELDHSNRLLLQFARYGAETVCLALEVIENHAYDRSRFLRGAPVDESKIEHESGADPANVPATEAKLREAQGRVLYVTQSAYLAQSARALYDAHGYENAEQGAEFLSLREFLETLRVPAGREVSFTAFQGWFDRERPSAMSLSPA